MLSCSDLPRHGPRRVERRDRDPLLRSAAIHPNFNSRGTDVKNVARNLATPAHLKQSLSKCKCPPESIFCQCLAFDPLTCCFHWLGLLVPSPESISLPASDSAPRSPFLGSSDTINHCGFIVVYWFARRALFMSTALSCSPLSAAKTFFPARVDSRDPSRSTTPVSWLRRTLAGIAANLRAKILDFIGSDSSKILSVQGGILMSIGNSPEVLSQAIKAGIILVGRLAVARLPGTRSCTAARRQR